MQKQHEIDDGSYHIPVMVDQVMQFLIGDLNGIYIDATLGGAGHTSVLLDHLNENAQVIGFDRDPDAHKAAADRIGGDKRFIPIFAPFSSIRTIASQHGISGCNGIFADFGVSSYQLDAAARGFSFMREGPLDLRMNQKDGPSAAELIEAIDEKDLADLIFRYGEERRSRGIAKAIVRERGKNAITKTTDLVSILDRCLPPKNRIKSIARVFQALRIAVNDELTELESFLDEAFHLLNPNGHLVMLTYHSLEDRLAKRFIVQKTRDCICPPELPICVCEHRAEGVSLTKKAVSATAEEIEKNPRARSAKLRAIKKI
ncbi:MAG: 16S rRNA (cytosine(1402)-N(4))-methyltransferase RsmH [Calditrichaeota bacterium]|nr:MAG: 16S rRNA (cytosine(1402)-N(4))-methyltransferase RsmH [Calditrichota bacterium]